MKLDTKHRPGTFDSVIGQEVPVDLLRAIVQQRRYNSAYMFSGPSGTGKTTLARIFAKAILCENPIKGNPCCVCPSCLLFQEDKHFGYRELDAASFGGKEDMVKLRDEAAFQAFEKMKIILIDECHEISGAGQNSLLKQLEQCPDHLIYLFCTTEAEKVKSTVRKRCIHFQVSRVNSALIFERLSAVCALENIQFEETALRIIADRSKGHVRDSLKLLEEVSCLGPVTAASVARVSVDVSQEVFDVISNLGRDLGLCLEAHRKISCKVSAWVLYEEILSMVNDAVKVLYGFEDFLAQRKELLIRLRDIHGSSLIEFLNYLITRDKFVDRVGVQSDLILLHYKFNSSGFKPTAPVPQPVAPPVTTQTAQPEQQIISPPVIDVTPSNALTHAQLTKMSVVEKAQALRQQRQVKNTAEKVDPQKVPVTWSLPKTKETQAVNGFEEPELTPLEFSLRLIGGRFHEEEKKIP